MPWASTSKSRLSTRKRIEQTDLGWLINLTQTSYLPLISSHGTWHFGHFGIFDTMTGNGGLLQRRRSP